MKYYDGKKSNIENPKMLNVAIQMKSNTKNVVSRRKFVIKKNTKQLL